MAKATRTQIGVTNPGGVRIDILQGPISVATVYELIPFGNTIVTLKATGAQVKAIMEEGVDFSLGRYGKDPVSNPLVYVSGLKFSVDFNAAKGQRVKDLMLVENGVTSPVDPSATYTMSVNNFIAAGGDHYDTLNSISGKIDTGFIDAELLLDYIKGKTLMNPETRITPIP